MNLDEQIQTRSSEAAALLTSKAHGMTKEQCGKFKESLTREIAVSCRRQWTNYTPQNPLPTVRIEVHVIGVENEVAIATRAAGIIDEDETDVGGLFPRNLLRVEINYDRPHLELICRPGA